MNLFNCLELSMNILFSHHLFLFLCWLQCTLSQLFSLFYFTCSQQIIRFVCLFVGLFSDYNTSVLLPFYNTHDDNESRRCIRIMKKQKIKVVRALGVLIIISLLINQSLDSYQLMTWLQFMSQYHLFVWGEEYNFLQSLIHIIMVIVIGQHEHTAPNTQTIRPHSLDL